MCVSICVPGVLKDKGDLQRGWGVEPRGADVSAKERLRRFYYVYNRAKVCVYSRVCACFDGARSCACMCSKQCVEDAAMLACFFSCRKLEFEKKMSKIFENIHQRRDTPPRKT